MDLELDLPPPVSRTVNELISSRFDELRCRVGYGLPRMGVACLEEVGRARQLLADPGYRLTAGSETSSAASGCWPWRQGGSYRSGSACRTRSNGTTMASNAACMSLASAGRVNKGSRAFTWGMLRAAAISQERLSMFEKRSS